MLVLAFETSCDDTSVSILEDGKILSNVVSSQLKHSLLGGVVPELASRLHLKNISFVLREALLAADKDLTEVDLIAYTYSPGLAGALMVGNCFAKGLSLSLNKPMMAIDHMEGHVMSLFLAEKIPEFPFLCLTVSGGHTQIELISDYFDRKIIGKTKDDAAGEAFDKIAKMLDLPYPGGPIIDKLAEEGNADFHRFPIPQMSNFDFSFSGLKTAVLYYLRDKLEENPDFINKHQNDICASVRKTIVNYLLKQLFSAAEKYHIRQLGIVGGVSANRLLRKTFEQECNKRNLTGIIPPFQYCTDNAAMIAFTAYQKYKLAPHTVSSHYVTVQP